MARTALVAILSLCLVLAGCTMSRVPVERVQASADTVLHQGDIIQVTLRSGEQRRLKLLAVTAETLTGTDLDRSRQDSDGATSVSIQIAVAEIQSLKVRKSSGAIAAGVVIGVVAVAAGFFLFSAVLQCGSKLNDCGD